MSEHKEVHPEKVRRIEKLTLLVSIITGSASIGIALIYGAWGIHLANQNNALSKRQVELDSEQILLSKKQDTTSLDLQHFAKLLNKTDTVITLSENELNIDKQTKGDNDSANKFRFIAAIFRLGGVIGTKQHALKQLTQPNCEGCADFLLRDISPIFESQLNNPYLCENDEMLKRWINAYIHLLIAGQTEQYFVTEDGKHFITTEKGDILEAEREHLRIDEIINVKMEAGYLHAWSAADSAFQYCGQKLKNTSSHFIKP